MATTDLMVEKASKPKAFQTPEAIYIYRPIFRFQDPTGLSANQWRLVAREPVNKMAQRFIARELASLDWEILSDKKDDPRIKHYTDEWDNIYEGGAGWIVWLFRMVDDATTLPFGAASEVNPKHKEGELEFCNHIDGATLMPTYEKIRPYVQVHPDDWTQRVYFKRDQMARMLINARPEIQWKEYQNSPTEEGFMPIEALSKIYLYYMQELSDTPAMGILDVMDMTKDEALDWAVKFREMMTGTDPIKIPVLYDHEVPAKWIPFNRSPADLNIPEQFKRFAELLLGKYGLSIGDLRLFEHESTKAGERVSQLVTERSGVGFWASRLEQFVTSILPSGLKFRFKQPRPEREAVVASRKATQLNMLQAAAGTKQLISVEDAVQEAVALELFSTEVKPKDEPEQADFPFAPGAEGQGTPGGQPPPERPKTDEEKDTDEDKDLSKAVLWDDIQNSIQKALGQAFQHPTATTPQRAFTALWRGAFDENGRAVQPDDVGEMVQWLEDHQATVEEIDPKALEATEEKGGPGSGNWAHAGRPGKRGGSAAGGGLSRIGAKPQHGARARRALSRRARGRQGEWAAGKAPTREALTATVRAKRRAQAAAAARRAEAETPKRALAGEETLAFGADPSKKYAFRHRVVELDSLVTSNKMSGEINPDYDQALQPRIRDRAASELQIDNIARNLEPEAVLWDFHQLDKGTPIVGGDMMVEGGNGRTMALQRAEANYPEQWENYQDALGKQVADVGIDPAQLAGMTNPVLVRERITEVPDRGAFAAETNTAQVLQMSPLELAKQDAGRITPDSLTNFTVREGQSIDQALRAPANRTFVSNFMGDLPANEAAGIMRADGTLNRMGIWRVKAAMFSSTFPGESGDRLADTFFESVDHTTRNFENAMSDVLPRLARAQGMIASGQRSASLDLSNDISRAVDMHARVKEMGLSAREYVSQTTLWDRELSPGAERLLVRFSDASNSRKEIRGILGSYADGVLSAADPAQGTMFGGVTTTGEDLLDRMINQSEVGRLLQTLEVITKGGPGSGNFGHAGRPGTRGGSAARGGGTITAGAMAKAVSGYLGVNPSYGQFAILETGEFDRRFGAPNDAIHGGVAAIRTDDGDIFIKQGFESDGVHELVHASGALPGEDVGDFLNEGITQAATERIGQAANLNVRATYGRETDFVNKYVLPTVGMPERDFFRGYVGASEKGRFVADAIWKAHGGKFGDPDDWGVNVKQNFYTSIPHTRAGNQYLTFLVDEMSVKGGPGSGNFGHAGRPGTRGGSAARGVGPGAGAIHYGGARAFGEAEPSTFAATMAKMPESKRPFLTMYSPDEYKEMGATTYISDTGKSGYALKPDGDIISVFSMPGAKEGKSALKSAIENGGTKLDCFDGFLAGAFYPQFGFGEKDRLTWDDQYMPTGWDKEKYDSPDVVLMSLGG